MATYAIGDVQGCYLELLDLLETIQFNEKQDRLLFTGDLVNRGPQSLETLRFVKDKSDQGIAQMVLGNHDISLLALASTTETPLYIKNHTLEAILKAPDCDSLLAWLAQQPLLYEVPNTAWILVHAGLSPQWDLVLSRALANEASEFLQKFASQDLFQYFGNDINLWTDDLTGIARLRYIISTFTRIRFCHPNGSLDFDEHGDQSSQGLIPWFKYPNRKYQGTKILFGHWAALKGKTEDPEILALDTGCIWGNQLSAFCLETEILYQVSCSAYKK